MLGLNRRNREVKLLAMERDEARAIAERQLIDIIGYKLQLSLKPDPAYRGRRYAQLSTERQKRFTDTIAALGTAGGSEFLKEIHRGKTSQAG